MDGESKSALARKKNFKVVSIVGFKQVILFSYRSKQRAKFVEILFCLNWKQ